MNASCQKVKANEMDFPFLWRCEKTIFQLTCTEVNWPYFIPIILLVEVITFILISIMRIAHNNYYVYAIVSFRVEKSRLEKQLPIYVWYLFNAFVGKSSLLRIDIWIDNINWRLILERSIKCSFQVNRIIIVFS